MTRLNIVSADGESGEIVVKLQDDNDREYDLTLSVFDVSTLVSGLYSARDEALKQPVKNTAPEVMLPLASMNFGGDEKWSVLRVFVTEGVFQDFAAPKGSTIADILDGFAAFAAKHTGHEPTPWGGPTGKA